MHRKIHQKTLKIQFTRLNFTCRHLGYWESFQFTCKPLENFEMIVEWDNGVPGVPVDVDDLGILILDSLRKHFIGQVGLDDSLLRLRKSPEIYVHGSVLMTSANMRQVKNKDQCGGRSWIKDPRETVNSECSWQSPLNWTLLDLSPSLFGQLLKQNLDQTNPPCQGREPSRVDCSLILLLYEWFKLFS